MKDEIIGKMSRQFTLTEDEREDFCGYDDIVAMKVKPIPNLSDEDYYVQFVDTTGRDIVQQAVNIYSTQKPKWDVLPIGQGDVKKAEKMERVIEWYLDKASQMGRKRFHSEALINACKYNRVCAQLEWEKDDDKQYYFCVKIYHPSSILFEYGSKLQWVGVYTNVTAVSIIEHWRSYAEEPATSGARSKKNGSIYNADKINAALKKIEKLIEDDEEQRMMYVDYTDDKTRYTYCYKVSDDKVDDTFGCDDDGNMTDDVIVIQDKENKLGFINWAIAEGEGDPLLAPMLKANLYENLNDSETILRTKALMTAFEPMFLQEGREDADAEIDYSGGQTVIKAPTGARMTKLAQTPLDPGFSELAGRDRNIMTNSIGIGQTASLQISNVQHATLQDQIKLRLAQLEPYKRITEQAFIQIAYLIFKWAKKNDEVLTGIRLYSKGKGLLKGSDIIIKPSDINMNTLHITCNILANNENDKLQMVNQISMLMQSGIPVPTKEFVEQLYIGNPEVLKSEYQMEKIEEAALEAKRQAIINETQMDMQKQMAEFQAELEMKTNMAMQKMQMDMQAQAMGQQQQMAMQQQPGAQAPQQSMPMPSDQQMQGPGFNAGQGGMPPQEAAPGLTQAQRPQ